MSWFLQALRSWKDFEGRARRSEYWFYFLFVILIYIVAMAIDYALGIVIGGVIGPVTLLAALVFFVPSLAVMVRRLHDIGRSGWWVLLGVIPIVSFIGGIVLLIFALLDSQAGDNQFGPNPKGVTGAAPFA